MRKLKCQVNEPLTDDSPILSVIKRAMFKHYCLYFFHIMLAIGNV